MRLGLGRAILHVRERGAAGLEDSIIRACQRDDTYDGQVESRHAYLVELLQSASLVGRGIPALADVLANAGAEPDRSCHQAVDILSGLAASGHDDAAERLRAAFEVTTLQDAAAYAQVELDGVNGLRRVARTLGATLRANPSAPLPRYLGNPLFTAKELLGEEAAMAALEEVAALDENARAYRDAVLRKRAVREMPAARKTLTLDDVRDADTSNYDGLFTLRRFGRHAAEAQIRSLLDELRTETTPSLVERYLHPLAERGLTSVDERVLELASDPLPRLRRLSVLALQTVNDARVRELALVAMRDRGCEAMLDEVPRLLSKNYLDGDHRVLEESLDDDVEALDDNGMHLVCFGLRPLLEAQPRDELLPLALWTYEHTPCGHCRGRVIDVLRQLDPTPGWLTDEMPFDTRALERLEDD